MKLKIFIVGCVIASVVGAYFHLTADPPPLEVLLQVPKTAAGASARSVADIVPASPLADHREDGRITVFALVTARCPGCNALREHVRMFTRLRPDVAVRMINLDDGRPEAVRNVSVATVPHVMIYGPGGRLLAADDGRDKAGLTLLYEWINAEIRRDHESKLASR